MRFAIIDKQLLDAEFGFKEFCPGCLQSVIARCGTEKIHHWVHLKNKVCDSWWEPETEWHSLWKIIFQSNGKRYICLIDLREENTLQIFVPFRA
ncbi:competence protein CoiA family protein [Arcticibacter eurypsychrophilus]|uniref:competence protein CoiA family protein n=1 Tax=Arcticibacter eurypsychrophilus TaxID=1434752 RepID=UPI00084D00E8|nr:competence protein CoiA family protein [Arcticibacter eurypsychrophilus]